MGWQGTVEDVASKQARSIPGTLLVHSFQALLGLFRLFLYNSPYRRKRNKDLSFPSVHNIMEVPIDLALYFCPRNIAPPARLLKWLNI